MPAVSRRRLLAVGAVGLGAVGGAAAGLAVPRPRRTARPGDVQHSVVLEAALARERELLARLEDTDVAQPALRTRVAVLRRDHAAHADALAGLLRTQGLAVPSATSVTGASTTAASASAAPTPPPTPRPYASVVQLVADERRAAAGARRDSAALPAAGAALLASICASETAHAVWLP